MISSFYFNQLFDEINQHLHFFHVNVIISIQQGYRFLIIKALKFNTDSQKRRGLEIKPR